MKIFDSILSRIIEYGLMEFINRLAVGGLLIACTTLPVYGADRSGDQVVDRIRDLELSRDDLNRAKQQAEQELLSVSQAIVQLKQQMGVERKFFGEFKLNRKQNRAEELRIKIQEINKELESIKIELADLALKFINVYQRTTEYLMLEIQEVNLRYSEDRRSADLELKRKLAKELRQWRRSRIYVDSVTTVESDYTIPDIKVNSDDSPEDIRNKTMFLNDLDKKWRDHLMILDQGIRDLEREVEMIKLYADFIDDRIFHDDENAPATELVKPKTQLTSSESATLDSHTEAPRIASVPENPDPSLKEESSYGVVNDIMDSIVAGPEPSITTTGTSELEELTQQIQRLKQKRENLQEKVTQLNERLEEIRVSAVDLGYEAAP